MGRFQRMAEKVAGLIGDNEFISAEQLPGIIGDTQGGDPFNCYPGGKPDDYGCCDLAVFVALKAYKRARGRRLSCSEALQLIVNHEAKCPETRNFVFITYDWDSVAAVFWMANLHKIQSHAQLEIYLIVTGNVNEIVLKF